MKQGREIKKVERKSVDVEFSASVDAGRMASVANDEEFSVVVEPALLALDEDVRLNSKGGRRVEEVVLETDLAAVRGAPHRNLLLVDGPFDPGEEKTS